MMRVPQMFWKVWRSGHQQPATIAAVQQRRLLRLVQFARHHSFWYQQHYRQVPEGCQDAQLLLPVTKADLMAHFDEWVTDRAVTKTGAEAFVADKTRIGERYLDRYAVWSTSGVTGHPGYFVQDLDALAVYTALMTVRGYRWLTPGRLGALVKGGGRFAIVAAIDGHFTLTDYFEHTRRVASPFAQRLHPFSVLTPLPALVQALNDFRPAVLVGYPTIMQLLAQEQQAGRLQIAPLLVSMGGEYLTPEGRTQIATAFRCLVQNNYGASEFMHIAF